MLHRLMMEAVDKKSVARIVGEKFDGFTLFDAEGYWKGTPEKSLVVEIVAGPEREADVKMVGETIRYAHHQEAVLYQKMHNHSVLLTENGEAPVA